MDFKTHFINLLKNSALPETRQNYWINKFESGQFTQEDEQIFINELETQLNNLNLQIFDKKNELREKQMKLQNLNEKLVPELEIVAEQSEGIFAEDNKHFQNEALSVESKAIQHMEKSRRDEEAAEIARLKSSFQ